VSYSDRDSDLTPHMVSVKEQGGGLGGKKGAVEGVGLGGEEGAADCEGRWKALVLSFTLPPSSYATMMIREAMKASTHPSDQFRLRLELEAQEDAASGNKWQARLKQLVQDGGYRSGHAQTDTNTHAVYNRNSKPGEPVLAEAGDVEAGDGIEGSSSWKIGGEELGDRIVRLRREKKVRDKTERDLSADKPKSS